MRQLTDSEREARTKKYLEYEKSNKTALTFADKWAFDAGFIAGLDHTEAQLAAVTAERDALRAALQPFARVGELVKPLPGHAAADTYLWKQDSTTQADEFGITLADCIEAWRTLTPPGEQG